MPDPYGSKRCRSTHRSAEQQVVLVDGYDEPILDVRHGSDFTAENRNCPRGFCGIITDCALFRCGFHRLWQSC